MKIYQITTFFHPVTGGVERHVYDLALNLKNKGFDVEVLCSDSSKVSGRLKEHTSMINGIKVHRFTTFFSFSYFHKFYPGLLFFLLKNDFDILHVHGFRRFETYIALLVAKLKKKKVILTSHNPFPTSTRPKFLDLIIKIHDKTLGKWFTKKLNKIIVLLNSEKKIFHKDFNVPKEKLLTIPDAIDDQFMTEGNKEQFYKEWNIKPEKWQGIVIFAGRINQAKGIQNLYKAVTELPKTLFFIAGGNDGYLDKLKVLFAKNKNIIFSERFLPSIEKLINLYAAGDIFVFPSMHEAFGLVLLEALAQGKPVISTNVGGPSDYITPDVGILLNPTDQLAWKNNIRDLLNNPNMLKNMSQKAKIFAQKYVWSKQINKFSALYRGL